MKTQIKIILLAILSVFLIYLILPDNQITIAYADEEGKGSTIAGVNVAELERDDMVKAIQEAIDRWITDPIIISGAGKELYLDASTLQFNIEETIDEYEKLVDTPWYAFWASEKVVHIPLHVNDNEEVKTQIAAITVWDTNETYNQVLSQASFLKNHEIEATVSDLSLYENERLSLSIEEIPEDVNGIENIIDVLNYTVVSPGETFSLIQTLGDSGTLVNNEALNFIASMLYDGILQTEYEIVERYPQEEIPTFLEAGREAFINSSQNKDLKFKNSSDHVALIKATIEDTSLKLEIYSDTAGKGVLVQIDKQYVAPRVIYRYSNDLAIGQEELIQEGAEGLRVTVTRTISDIGEVTEQQVSNDYYAPVNRIILKSSRQPDTSINSESVPETLQPETPQSEESDEELQLDLDGDGLPDYEMEKPISEDELPPGSYYDKGGNLITP